MYLRFGAANYLTEVYLNGGLIGTHSGGYTAFAFDITPFVRYDMSNQLLVKVSNADGLPVPPLSADFTFFGGLIRGVELIKKKIMVRMVYMFVKIRFRIKKQYFPLQQKCAIRKRTLKRL